MDARLTIFICLCLAAVAASHQSMAYPYPISKDVACRISSNANCPGPCPTRNLRADQTPNNPAVTVKRGGWMTVNTLANNHRGGFSRWTLVHVRDMRNKFRHHRNAFLYSCSDTNLSKCTVRDKRKNCNYDLKNEYYKHPIQIPKVYPDGVYVLGWVWYGGGERWGQFGDYYDCMYVRVLGGPLENAHRPVFRPGNSVTKRGDKCRATVNRIGVCYREPCPGGGRYTTLQKPWEFVGRQPQLITRDMFQNPFKIKERVANSPFIKSLTIRSAANPNRIFTSSLQTSFPYIRLTLQSRSTVTAEVTGKVKFVTFYINGREGRTDFEPPYSIAGDWVEFRTQQTRYSPWMFDVGGKVITLSAKAVGFDGTFHYRNIELSTDFGN